MKRIFDLAISLILLLCLSPLITITACMVRLKLGSPVLFKQQRPGLYGKPFSLYKFRTMTHQKDGHGQLLPDKVRLTSFGKFLRKYSLDEFPQLINVIKGDISLVGPRPLLIEYLPLYTEEQAKRHNVKPGITGWAQVNGRNTITWEEKFKLDLWYVNNQSFLLDMKILVLTALKVVKSEGINQHENATMETFKGSNSVVREDCGSPVKIVVIGQGGHSKVIRDIILSKDHNQIIGYLDDQYKELFSKDNTYFGPILSAKRIIEQVENVKFIIAIGDNKVRKLIVERLNIPDDYYISLIHQSACISPSAHIGNGTVVMAHAVVNADAKIGNHTIINTNSIVEHDNTVGNFVHISPSAVLTGSVEIEDGVHVGAGAAIIPNSNVGAWSVIGAGAAVVNNIPSHCTAVGIPAKIKMEKAIGGV